MLFALFIVWLIVAQHIYTTTFEAVGPVSFSTFLSDVLTTSQGLSLIIWGNLAGFVLRSLCWRQLLWRFR